MHVPEADTSPIFPLTSGPLGMSFAQDAIRKRAGRSLPFCPSDVDYIQSIQVRRLLALSVWDDKVIETHFVPNYSEIFDHFRDGKRA
jgi:hypothetical protein